MKKVVMDVGCGTSLEIVNYLGTTPTFDTWIIGIEWDPHFCRQSKEKAKEHGIDAEYVRCDVAYLPFLDETFDAVYMLDTIRCLKGHPLPEFINEVHGKLKHAGELFITGLDKVSYRRKKLPEFKESILPFSWDVYVPKNGSSPFLSKEPTWTEVNVVKKYKYVGVLRERLVSELLRQCGIEPEIEWKIKKEGDYTYHYYETRAHKASIHEVRK